MENMINDLKGICQLLGINIDENGLSDCDLTHSYLQRITTFLGG
jgi:hypothetical protein